MPGCGPFLKLQPFWKISKQGKKSVVATNRLAASNLMVSVFAICSIPAHYDVTKSARVDESVGNFAPAGMFDLGQHAGAQLRLCRHNALSGDKIISDLSTQWLVHICDFELASFKRTTLKKLRNSVRL